AASIEKKPDRNFASAGTWDGPEMITQELIDEWMKGFGSDSDPGFWAAHEPSGSDGPQESGGGTAAAERAGGPDRTPAGCGRGRLLRRIAGRALPQDPATV